MRLASCSHDVVAHRVSGNDMKVGYTRVSTKEQSLEAQTAALLAAGCEELYSEKQSGASTNARPELKASIKFVRKGDALVVTKLDRLARSILDLNDVSSFCDRHLATVQSGQIACAVYGTRCGATPQQGRSNMH